MKTALSASAYLILAFVAGSLAVAGCGQRAPADRLTTGSAQMNTVGITPNGATLVLTPSVLAGGFKTQAIVTPLTSADIDHVVLSIFTLSGGFETPVLGPDGQPLQAIVPASELNDPVEFSELAFETTYRVRSSAYSASASAAVDKISDDGGSYVDIHVANDDRPVLSMIPCQLNDVWFDGVASGTIDVIPGTVRYQGYPTIGVASPAPLPTAAPSAAPSSSPTPAPSPSSAVTPVPTMSPSALPTPAATSSATFMDVAPPDASGLRISNFLTIDSVAGASPGSVWNLGLSVSTTGPLQYWIQWGTSLTAAPGTVPTSFSFGDLLTVLFWAPGSTVMVSGPAPAESVTVTLGPNAPAHSYQDDVTVQ